MNIIAIHNCRDKETDAFFLCLNMGIVLPALAEWMWAVPSTELAWNSNKRCWKYNLVLDNNKQNVGKKVEMPAYLLYCCFWKQSQILWGNSCSCICRTEFWAKSLWAESVDLFSCQVTDCVLKTFFFLCFKDISLHIDLCCDDILCLSKCHASELYEIWSGKNPIIFFYPEKTKSML